MGEVADLGAGAVDNLLIRFKNRVQLVDQGRDFGRKIAFDAGPLAAPQLAQRTAHAVERTQAPAGLDEGGGDQADTEDGERDRHAGAEGKRLPLQRAGIAGDGEIEGAAAFQRDAAGEEAQRLVCWPRQAPSDDAVAAGRRHRLAHVETVGEQRVRAQHHQTVVGAAHFPVPAGIDQLEALFAEIAGVGERLGRVFGAKRADQRLQIDVEALVEGLFGVLAIEIGEDEAGDDQRRHAPQGRGGDQAGSKRVKPHHPARRCGSRARVRFR